MTRTLLTFTIAGAAALSISTAAQTPSAPSAPVPKAGESVTFTGCVRQASDQATLFALFSTGPSMDRTMTGVHGSAATPDPTHAGTRADVSAPTSNPTDRSTGAAQNPSASAPSTRGATPANPSRTEAPDGRANQAPPAASRLAGTWYRLTPSSNAQDLKEFVGKTVRVTGTYTPATRASIGTENPSMTEFTVGDVSHSPLIALQSVTPVAMTCSLGTGN